MTKHVQDYVALEKMHLPILDAAGNVVGALDKKAGEPVTAAELEAAGQTADDILRLTTEHLPAEPDEHGSPQHTEGIAMCLPGEYEERSKALKTDATRAAQYAAAEQSLKALGFSDTQIDDMLDGPTPANKGGAAS